MRVVVFIFLFVSSRFVFGQPPGNADNSEYQIKAVFLFNFAQFVEWPASFLQDGESFIIGVLGEDPFGYYLDEVVRGEQINGRPLVVKRYTGVDEVEACHILFISQQENRYLKTALARLKSRSILTVGEVRDFTQYGGIIQFFTENRKIRIRINLEVAKNADLTISSKLLRIAEIVGPLN